MDAGNPNPLYGEEMINNYRNNVDPELYPNVNWLDAVIERHGFQYCVGDLTITVVAISFVMRWSHRIMVNEASLFGMKVRIGIRLHA